MACGVAIPPPPQRQARVAAWLSLVQVGSGMGCKVDNCNKLKPRTRSVEVRRLC